MQFDFGSFGLGTLLGILVTALVQHWLSVSRDRRGRASLAAERYRGAIDPDRYTGLKGHALHGVLIGSFPDLKKAVREFRLYLNAIDGARLDSAWAAYHGGDEDNPDFVPYYVHANGPLLLRKRLQHLRGVGDKI